MVHSHQVHQGRGRGRERVQRDAEGAPGAAQNDHKRRVERAPRRGRSATMWRGMRASGHDITSPPPPTTIQSLVPTHSHSWLVVDAIKLS